MVMLLMVFVSLICSSHEILGYQMKLVIICAPKDPPAGPISEEMDRLPLFLDQIGICEAFLQKIRFPLDKIPV